MNIGQGLNPTAGFAVDICCPRCHGTLSSFKDTHVICTSCASEYPIVRGIPVLIVDERSLFSVSDYVNSGSYEGASYGSPSQNVSGLKSVYRRFVRFLSESSIRISAFDSEAAIRKVQCDNPRAKILIVGSGESSYANDDTFTYSDVSFGANTKIIADAHDLPFPDESFDLLVAVAVMEHVIDPVRCAEEFWRVLRPNGLVYSATPFLQPVHMGAYDFTRWTLLGHRRLFRKFNAISTGKALGPGSTLAWAIRYFMASMSDRPTARKLLSLIGLMISLPIKYCDVFFRNSESAMDAAGGVYFFGSKRSEAVSDRDILLQYRGGQH